ncbi:MAG: serine/threonine protein kinase, partial [Phycisphaerales bacterium]|nr:serine/threonine protein kinase [Phycisphaerales bacterium]
MDPRVADIMARIATLSHHEREHAAVEACGTDKELLKAVLEAIAQSSDDNLVTVEVPPESGSAKFEAPPEAASRGDHGPSVHKVGHFRIEQSAPLGRGGFGEVWEGLRDEGGFRQRVAIKILSRSMNDDRAIRRFELERQVLASLDHPEIARLIDGGTLDDGRPWLAMEYVDGVSVTQYCDRERLTVEARIRLFQRVAMAVQHAHENLVIHRDIKPDNVLVTPEGGPKLLDFGIAKIVNPELGGVATAVTQAGEGVLTPDYAAPEQFTGEGIGVRSDVYSLGVLLYEL